MLSFSNTIAEKEEEEEDAHRQNEKSAHTSSSSSRLKLPAFKVMMRWFYWGIKDTQNWIDICITLIHARALNALLYAHKKHKHIMFSSSFAVKPSTTVLFSASSKKEKKTNAKRIVSMATIDGEENKEGKTTKEMPDRGFWSALAPDGEKSADDYNKWKAELMEKKRKAQEEAAKKPKKFLGLF